MVVFLTPDILDYIYSRLTTDDRSLAAKIRQVSKRFASKPLPTRIITNDYGHRFYIVGPNLFHREDGPASIGDNSYQWWYRNQYHRIGGPAVKFSNGDEHWYVAGERHREDGPAVITKTREEWWINGKLHRIGKPAVIEINNENIKKEWWFKGKLHREDGPAVEWGTIRLWFWKGKKHREDGPAEEINSDKTYWYYYGKKVRDPADLPKIKAKYWKSKAKKKTRQLVELT